MVLLILLTVPLPISSNNAQNQVFFKRENSIVVPTKPHLPVVEGRVRPVPSKLIGLGIVRGKHFGNGQCVALARAYGYNITGNAKTWPSKAVQAGYFLSKSPHEGAVVVTTESSRGTDTGHVAIVEMVTDSSIHIIEQNYVSAGVVSRRIIPINSNIVVTYIVKPVGSSDTSTSLHSTGG